MTSVASLYNTCGRRDAEGPDGVSVAVTVAIVLVTATITRCPDEDGPFASTTLRKETMMVTVMVMMTVKTTGVYKDKR